MTIINDTEYVKEESESIYIKNSLTYIYIENIENNIISLTHNIYATIYK